MEIGRGGGFWKRRGYERLNGTGRRRVNQVQMGSTRRRRFWRIKVVPKLRFLKTASPKKFLVWLRDAYVNMMLRLANSQVMNAGYRGAVCDGFGRTPMKEYDEKTIAQIYKSLVMAQGHLVPRDAAQLCSGIACRVR